MNVKLLSYYINLLIYFFLTHIVLEYITLKRLYMISINQKEIYCCTLTLSQLRVDRFRLAYEQVQGSRSIPSCTFLISTSSLEVTRTIQLPRALASGWVFYFHFFILVNVSKMKTHFQVTRSFKSPETLIQLQTLLKKNNTTWNASLG